MGRNGTILTGLLLASIALNTYLLWRPLKSAATTVQATNTLTQTEHAPITRHAAVRSPADAPPRPAERNTVALAGLEACSKQLKQATAELRQHWPLPKRFRRGEPNPSNEERVRAQVSRIFDADTPAYEVECRGDACRLSMVWNDDAHQGNWMRTIQSAEIEGVCGVGVTAATPSSDVFSGEGVSTRDVYMKMCNSDAADGMKIITGLIEAFEASDARGTCARRSAHKGALKLRVSVGLHGERRVSVQAGGTLASKPVGRCLVKRLQRLTEAEELPERVTGATKLHVVQI